MSRLLLTNLRKSSQVKRDQGLIKVQNFQNKNIPRDLILQVLDALKDDHKKISVDLTKAAGKPSYPSTLVPISAFYENLKKTNKDVEFILVGDESIAANTNFLNPRPPGLISKYPSVLNRVWKFGSPEDVFKLVTEYMDAIYKEDIFEGRNVLTAIEWCLNEVMDNVIQHAECEWGYVMGQIHPKTKNVVFCVSDAGRGILESLKSSGAYNPKTPTDAITLSLREGVTRDKKIGQGNGLWGLHQIVRGNSGVLRVSSAGATIDVSETGVVSHEGYVWLNKARGGTVLDFRLEYTKPLSLDAVLKGYEPMSLKIFKSTNDDSSIIHYKLIDKKSGYGTRKAGERVRNEVVNLTKESGQIVDLDFKGVGVVSSSFADELVGKLFLYLGPLKFNQLIRMTNMNSSIEAIINKAMEQRLKNAKDNNDMPGNI